MVRMDITPFVDELSDGLRLALSADTDPELADRLANAVTAPARLALMSAVSQAATEASSTLPGGRIAVQLAGPDLVVSYEPSLTTSAESSPDEPDFELDDDDQARLTLRLPASLKIKAEKAATGHGLSLNTWIVRVLREAVMPSTFDLHVGPAGFRLKTGNRHQKGWV